MNAASRCAAGSAASNSRSSAEEKLRQCPALSFQRAYALNVYTQGYALAERQQHPISAVGEIELELRGYLGVG